MPTDEARRRAKALIVELIRQNGGHLCNKTNLFKAFWRANVDAAAQTGRLLTKWPVVKMPRGPGIDKFDLLLGELLAEGEIKSEDVQVGGYTAIRFSVGKPAGYAGVLTSDEIAFTRAGAEAVAGMSAAAASHWSHEDSRSWREAAMGDELDLFLDAIPDEEFAERDSEMRCLSAKLEAILNTSPSPN